MQKLIVIVSFLISFSLPSQIVVLDAGHGWLQTLSSGGCVSGDSRCAIEHNTAYFTCLKTKARIDADCNNWQAFMTRNSNGCNSWVSLSQRSTMANNWNADVFLSAHTNAIGSACSGQSASGTESFYCSLSPSSNTTAANFCNTVQSKMVSYGSFSNRRAVEDNSYIFHLSVLRYTNAPGVLNEIGFGDNNNDNAKLASSTWRDQFAQAYLESFEVFFGTTCTTITPTDQGSCIQPILLNCGQTVSGNTAYGYSNMNTYSCGSSNEYGRELVYQFTVTTNSTITATLSNLSADLDIHLLSACNTSSCLSRNDNTITYSNLNPGTYFLVVDGFGLNSNLSGSFQLSLTCSTNTNSLGTCTNPLTISCGEVINSSTISGQALNGVYGCNGSAQNGRELFYQFDVLQDALVDIDLSNMTQDLDVHLLSSCNVNSCIASADSRISSIQLTTGTYYIVVDGASSTQGIYGDFTLNVTCANNQAPKLGVCNNPIPISCGNVYSGNTNEGEQNITSYSSCSTGSFSGKELVYSFVNQQNSDIDITISNLFSDLDVFLLNGCNGSSCLASNDTRITYSNLSQGVYYVIVDAVGTNPNITSSFDLSINCTPVIIPSSIDENEKSNNDFKIFPSITANNITVEFKSNESEDILLEILNTEGKLVYSEKKYLSQGKNTFSISTTSLSKGLYFLKSSSQPLYIKRFIKID